VPQSSSSPPTFARIDLCNLIHNLNQTRRRLLGACDILAIVKANAYGHGAVPVARALMQAGVRRFGVATIEEGAQLRESGIDHSIVVLGPLVPGEIPALVAHRLTPVIYDLNIARELVKQVRPAAKPYPIHVKIDTGMGRLGLNPDDWPALLETASLDRQLMLEGVMTHLADADSDDPAYTNRQLEQFHSALGRVAASGHKPPLIHMANSAGIIRHPASHYSLVRPGIMLYGYHTLSRTRPDLDLRPILSWHTTVATIRSIPPGGCVGYNRTFIATRASRIAVLPVGYADGYSRRLSNTGRVLIGSRHMPVVGRVSMDMTMVDVTDLPEAKAGDPVVLLGTQGTAAITATDIAGMLETIPYEVLCSIGPRVPRLYNSDSKPAVQ
jgi:alanine racemase